MYAFGLCIDEQYLVPGVAALVGLADSLTPAARREAAVRVLTLDLAPSQALFLADLAKRAGFGSFDLRRCAPLRSSRMADASYITVTTYLRFEFTPSFVRRPYLIYVDADVLVRGDVSEPLGSLTPDETGAVQDEFNPAVGECPALPGAADRWPHLRGRPYFNAGVLWTHTDHMPRIRRGVEQALIHARRHILHNDQDALNLWLLRSGRVRPVAGGFNRFEVGRFLERGNWVRRVVTRSPKPDPTAALVHFVGPEKPWQADCPDGGSRRIPAALGRGHASRPASGCRRRGTGGCAVSARVPPAVSRAALALTGVPARTARRLSARTRTVVYRVGLTDGRSVVIKLYAATARRNAITESAAIRAVADHVPVPALIGYGHVPGHEATALVTADLGPLTLGSAMRSGRISDERALKDLAGLLGRLHRAPVRPWVPRRPLHEQVTSLGRRCPPSSLDRIAPALAAIADAVHTAPVWCHGDLHGDNVVIAGPRAIRHLVDFTDAAAGPRESDVAQTLVMADALSTLRARTVTDAYPLALDDHLLGSWGVFHTLRSWAHSSPGDDRALWARRLDDLSRRTPHLFRTRRPERTR